MSDRLFSVEFGPFQAIADSSTPGAWIAYGDYRTLPASDNLFWVTEHKLDLSGYTMEDLTVYFRNSFEQMAGSYFINWNVVDPNVPIKPNDADYLETVILSSVPMNDDNLSSLAFGTPGFITPDQSKIDFGNFNRTHIIHGTKSTYSIDTSFGSDVLTADGAAYSRLINYADFSSLEPTAADCIYCYRVFMLPPAYDSPAYPANLSFVDAPAKRVLLNAMTDKEPDIEYLMRLKRSYELANQV